MCQSNVWIKLLSIPVLFLSPIIFSKLKDKYPHSLLSIPKWFKILTLLLVIGRGSQLVYRFSMPIKSLEDLAIMNIRSIDVLVKQKKNPYATKVDDYNFNHKGKHLTFIGQKYPSVQMILYAPCVLLWKSLGFDAGKGIYATNLIFYILLLAFFFKVFKRDNAILATFLILSTDFLFTLSFNKGTNDLMATVLLTYGLYYSNGIVFGLSLACKQLPAGLMLPYVATSIFKNPKMVFAVVLTFTATQLPFLLWEPLSYWNNVIYFHLIRPVRETSFLVYLPHLFQQLFQLFGAIIMIVCMGILKMSSPSSKPWEIMTKSVTVFLLFSKMSPCHYFVWILPSMILWYVRFNESPNSSCHIQ